MNCPDCNCEMPGRGTYCCDDCHQKRKDAIKARDGMPVGGTSCSPEYELRDLWGENGMQKVIDHSDVRGLPALRSDVRWHQYKHGGG